MRLVARAACATLTLLAGAAMPTQTTAQTIDTRRPTPCCGQGWGEGTVTIFGQTFTAPDPGPGLDPTLDVFSFYLLGFGGSGSVQYRAGVGLATDPGGVAPVFIFDPLLWESGVGTATEPGTFLERAPLTFSPGVRLRAGETYAIFLDARGLNPPGTGTVPLDLAGQFDSPPFDVYAGGRLFTGAASLQALQGEFEGGDAAVTITFGSVDQSGGSVVPEPSSFALLGLGVLALAGVGLLHRAGGVVG